MRIALINIGFPPDTTTGGMVTLYWNLARALRDAGHELLVVCSSRGEDSESLFDGIKVVRRRVRATVPALESLHRPLGATHTALSLTFDLYQSAVERVAEFAPEVVETPDYCGMGLPWTTDGRYPVAVRCMGPFSHMIGLGHMGVFSTLDQRLTSALEAGALASAHGVASLSDALADLLCERFELDRTSFEIIRSPYPSPQTEMKARQSSPIDGFPRLAYWGRIERHKGCGVLIEAFATVAKRFAQARLTLAGRSVPEFYDRIDFIDKLKARARELGVADRVRFVGELPLAEAPLLADAHDLCVFPSLYETAGYTVIEAMARGACVIASATGGTPEYLTHGESGWLVPANDAGALAAAVIKLTDDESLRSSLRSAAPLRIKNLCDPGKIAADSIAWYQRAIARHSAKETTSPSAVRRNLSRLHAALSDPGIEDFMAETIRNVATASFRQGYDQGYLVGYKDAERNRLAQ